MWVHAILAGCSLTLAFRANATPEVAWMFFGVATWQVLLALTVRRSKRTSPVLLRLGGLSWTMEDFCRGWLITGQTGSGKTLGAINAMLWQVSRSCPNWGGLCVDDKGVYAETLRAMFRALGREQDLIVLEVRPENAPRDWLPRWTFNFLDDPHLPYSAKAKLICDVASSMGQKTEQSFFKVQAQVQMEFAFRALKAGGMCVALDTAHDFLVSDNDRETALAILRKTPTAAAEDALEHYV